MEDKQVTNIIRKLATLGALNPLILTSRKINNVVQKLSFYTILIRILLVNFHHFGSSKVTGHHLDPKRKFWAGHRALA